MSINENREFYVYEHIRLDNMTCFYVGKGKGERAYDLERNFHHDRISNRYGNAVVIIKNHLTEKEAFELERDTIEDYVFNLGYGIDIEGYKDYDHKLPHLTNMTWGGEGVSRGQLSEEYKKNLSEAHKGKKLSEETKLKISKAIKGIQLSEEHKQNISESRKGIQFSEEHKQNISESHKGIQFSEEHKKNISKKLSKKVVCVTTGKIFNSIKEASNYYKCSGISNCCEGTYKSAGKLPNGTKLQWKYVKDYNNDFKGILMNPWNKGKKLFEEHELKLSKVNSKKVICITTGEIFNSFKEASNYYNVAQSSISSCCKGKLKSAGKLPYSSSTPLQWKYLKDYNDNFKGILINPITD